MPLSSTAIALLEAIEEPALLLDGDSVEVANGRALLLLGTRIVSRDIRLVLRHPSALEVILPGQGGSCEISGIGGREQPWLLTARPLGDRIQLVRLVDRSVVNAAERMRVDFVANASHELRTPLTTMIGYAETLAEDGPIDDRLRARFGGVIHAEAHRMLRLIEDLMSLSRIEADRFRTPEEPLFLDEIARLAAENGRSLAAQRDCTVRCEIERAGPVLGDLPQLLQLADNLVGNAIRYGCGRGGSAVIIHTARQGDRAVLRVVDEGEGISPEHLPRITERFYRVDAARSRDSGGTGLGLSIVKHIAERHRARLDIVSSVGTGTEVAVSFPLAPSAA